MTQNHTLLGPPPAYSAFFTVQASGVLKLLSPPYPHNLGGDNGAAQLLMQLEKGSECDKIAYTCYPCNQRWLNPKG